VLLVLPLLQLLFTPPRDTLLGVLSLSVRGAVSLPLSRLCGGMGIRALPCPALSCVLVLCTCNAVPLPCFPPRKTRPNNGPNGHCAALPAARVFHRSSPSPCLLGSGHVARSGRLADRLSRPTDAGVSQQHSNEHPGALKQHTPVRFSSPHTSPRARGLEGRAMAACRAAIRAEDLRGLSRTAVLCQETRLVWVVLFRHLQSSSSVQAPSKEEKTGKTKTSSQKKTQCKQPTISNFLQTPLLASSPAGSSQKPTSPSLNPRGKNMVGKAMHPPPTTPRHTRHTQTHPPSTENPLWDYPCTAKTHP